MAYGTVKVDNITFDNSGSDQNVTVSGLYRATTSGVTVSGTIAAATVSGTTIIGSTTVSGATVTGTTANFTSGNFTNLISSSGTMNGPLVMANQQQVRFREAVGNGVNYIALQAPAVIAADQTITLPDQTGTVVTTGDNGSVTSGMILDGTIGNAEINASAAIAGTKISPDFGSQNIVTTGIFNHALGTAAAPSIAFESDPNTGIYSPGADAVGVTTGGTERMRISSAGNVGIGTSSPSYLLTLNAGSATDTETAVQNTVGLSRFGTRSTGNAFAGSFTAGKDFELWAANAERLRIDSAGNVGIGTSSPNNALSIVGTGSTLANASIRINSTAGTQSANSGLWITGNQSTSHYNWLIGSQYNVSNAFEITPSTAVNGATFTTPALIVLQAGNVGIGTSSPTAKLHVETIPQASSQSGSVLFGPNTDYGFEIRNVIDGSGFPSVELRAPVAGSGPMLFFAGGSTERLRIDSSGRLLVGASTAHGDYFGSSGGYTGAFNATRNAYDATAQFHNWSNNGNLNTEGGTQIFISRSKSGTVGTHTALANGNDIGILIFNASDGTNFRNAASIKATCDGDVSTGDVPGRLVFSTTADGASSPTERMRIQQNGTVLVAKTVDDNTSTGITFYGQGDGAAGQVLAVSSADAGIFYRKTSSSGDGVILTKSDIGGTNTLVGAGYANGTFGTVSDATKKKNIETSRNYLEDIKKIRVVKYNWNTDEDSTPKELGWIAQEVEQVFPGMVSEMEGAKLLKKEVFVPMLMKCIQEQQAIIEGLEARLSALEAQ